MLTDTRRYPGCIVLLSKSKLQSSMLFCFHVGKETSERQHRSCSRDSLSTGVAGELRSFPD